MINNYFIWDKKSPINNSSAERILQSDFRFNELITVFFTDNGVPCHHVFYNEIPTEEELQNKLLEFNQQEEIQEQEQLSLKEQANKISILEKGLANAEYSLMMGGLI